MKIVPRYLLNFQIDRLPWVETDVLIIGSGIAGFFTALKVAGHRRVILVTKDDPEKCSTDLAQGGIAAAVDDQDSAELHLKDTLDAGAGLSSPAAAAVLTAEGPDRVRELIKWGVSFDYEGERLALGHEGAHSRRRILHAGGDATGAAIWQGLAARAMAENNIHLLTETMAIDLLVEDGRCYGALVLLADGSLQVIRAAYTVLASGGAGRLYPVTTNPAVATGDGQAMAYRAGAELMDLEFYQFHPTVLAHPGAPGFLVSEAARGEGAFLRNAAGERFMPGYHPSAELAPRDVVARAMADQMTCANSDHVFLDFSHLDAGLVEHRFPTIVATCRRLGLNPQTDWIPVAPAAHYYMGGVRTDLDGRTNIEALYAGGEVACTGVHGTNRLASNSLLEGVVFGGRIADDLLSRRPERPDVVHLENHCLREGGPVAQGVWAAIPTTMQRFAGLVRDAGGLEEAEAIFDTYWPVMDYAVRGREAAEARNLLLLARLIVSAAGWRRESRGAHYRADYSATDPAYSKRLVLARDRDDRELPV